MKEPVPSIPRPASPNLPVIDFSTWNSESSSSRRLEVARDLVEACHHTGFVYISNHGIFPARVEEAFQWSEKFFALPLEAKLQVQRKEETKIFRGYNEPGMQQIPRSLSVRGMDARQEGNSPDYNETYDMGSDENKMEPNEWISDEVLPGFRKFSTEFYWECWKTAQNVLRALALGLGLEDENYLLKYHTGHTNELSMKYYPSVPGSELQSHEKERLGAHMDMDCMTLLFQDDCGGLEVEKPEKPGEFVPAEPIENTLVMNVGDVLMWWSNDYLRSTIHRVQPPPLKDRYTGEEQMTRKRYSMPYFVLPEPDTVIECIPGCCNEKNPPRYKPRLLKDLMLDFAKTFQSESA